MDVLSRTEAVGSRQEPAAGRTTHVAPTGDVGDGGLAIRSVAIVVSDLDRSARFYEHVLELSESARFGNVAVLQGPSGGPSIVLRQAFRNARRAGDQGIGLRAVEFDVSSREVLARVADRLREEGAFDGRHAVGRSGECEIALGHDPDRVRLGFFAAPGESGTDDLDALQKDIYSL